MTNILTDEQICLIRTSPELFSLGDLLLIQLSLDRLVLFDSVTHLTNSFCRYTGAILSSDQQRAIRDMYEIETSDTEKLLFAKMHIKCIVEKVVNTRININRIQNIADAVFFLERQKKVNKC